VIEVEKVGFVSIPTRDVVRSRRFYGEVLGLTASLWQPEAQDVAFAPNTSGIALRPDPDGNVVILHRRYAPLA